MAEIFDIYEEGYAATGESRGAIYLGKGEGKTFLDACKDYIKKTGYGEIYSGSRFKDGKDRAGNWGCYWYPTLEQAQKNFG